MNINGISSGILLLMASVQSSIASAQDSGPYIGLSGGQTAIKDFCDGASSCDDSAAGWKIFGGYHVNQYVDIEAGYYDLGKAKASGTLTDTGISFTGSLNTDSNGFAVDLKGNLPIGKQFALFGKVGIAHTELEATLSGSGTVFGTPVSGTFVEKDTGVNLKLGIGAQFEVVNKLSVRLEWERFNDAGGDFEADIDFFSLGVSYRF